MVRVHYCPYKMWLIFFLICCLFLFNMYFFKMENDLLYKMYYTLSLCLCICIYYYIYVENLVHYFSQFLNEYLIIKDFQDMIIIYIKITFICTFFWSLNYLILISVFWINSIKKKTDRKSYQIFLIFYLVLNVFWVVKQDLFFSNWEIFLLGTKTLMFDIQPDFYIFFQNLIEDLYDFFFITSILYIHYNLFFNKINKLTTVQLYRTCVFVFLILYFIYFFSCESWINFLFFSIISLIIVESLLYTKFMLVELKKLIIKLKYFYKC